MSIYRVVAENHAETSENRIHSDDIAARLGFRGALVPGVAVYGYMTHPLVEALGEAWLSQHTSEVRFLKPAYVGDELRIELKRADHQHEITCVGPRDELLAVLHSRPLSSREPAPSMEIFSRPPVIRERPVISWETIDCEKPLPEWLWHADQPSNTGYALQVADFLPVYDRYVHPHWALATANYSLVKEFVMPAWIHVGSEIEQYQPFMVGTQITVQATSVEKWKKKAHEFIRLNIRYSDERGVLATVLHTAIFRIAGA